MTQGRGSPYPNLTARPVLAASAIARVAARVFKPSRVDTLDESERKSRPSV